MHLMYKHQIQMHYSKILLLMPFAVILLLSGCSRGGGDSSANCPPTETPWLTITSPSSESSYISSTSHIDIAGESFRSPFGSIYQKECTGIGVLIQCTVTIQPRVNITITNVTTGSSQPAIITNRSEFGQTSYTYTFFLPANPEPDINYIEHCGAWEWEAAEEIMLVDGGNEIQIVADDLNGNTAFETIIVTGTNKAPVFSSNSSVSVAENQTAVMSVVASDPEGTAVTYSLTGSVDDALFTIGAFTGVLSFKTPPDYEFPSDNDVNNIYDIQVTASDGMYTTNQSISITVTDANDAPVFVSPASVFMAENQTAVLSVVATDPDGSAVTYSLVGSIDDAFFTIDANTGALNFKTAPDYEAPADKDANNIYAIEVAATDGTLTTRQAVSITVTDVLLELNVASGGVKTLAFNWKAYPGASYYKLLVNPDGSSGYIQEGADTSGTSVDVTISVHLTDWNNASYMLEAYDANNNLIDGTDPISITNLMLSSIGDFKGASSYDDAFGFSIALSADGNTLAVGAKDSPDGAGFASGSVHLFRRIGGNWVREVNIWAPSTGVVQWFDEFGYSVALSTDGNTLAVGAPGEDSGSTGINSIPDESAAESGAVYLFQYANGNWAEEAYIKASNTGSGDNFGHSVALSSDGNTLAVGAYLENSGTTGINSIPDESAGGSGAAYLFRYASGNWAEEAYIKASNTGAGDNFGHSVALSSDGNTLAVGAYLENSGTTGINSIPDESAGGSGAAYLFRYASGNWAEDAYIKASNAEMNDNFGDAVALSSDGNTLAVGATGEDSGTTGINSTPDESAAGSGALYLFRYASGNWTEEAYIKASNSGAGDNFGGTVALSSEGNTLVAGATGEDSGTTGINSTPDESAAGSGALYLFRYASNNWAEEAYIKASSTVAGDAFGSAVSLNADGNTMAVGATEGSIGAVYVY